MRCEAAVRAPIARSSALGAKFALALAVAKENAANATTPLTIKLYVNMAASLGR
jgi:hypothetical protein